MIPPFTHIIIKWYHPLHTLLLDDTPLYTYYYSMIPPFTHIIIKWYHPLHTLLFNDTPFEMKWNEIEFLYPAHMIRNWHWCVWDESCQSGSPSKKLQRKKYWIRFYDRKKLYFCNINIYLYWYNIIVIFSFINQQITLIFK